MIAMTPITEDQVVSLMKGLEAREKRAMKRLSDAISDRAAQSGQATARVLLFKGCSAVRAIRPRTAAEILPIAKERAEKAARKTVQRRLLSLVPSPIT